MPDYDPAEDRAKILSRSICSRRELQESLMRRAFDGHSRHTPEQMTLLIEWRLSANNITPKDKAVLQDLNPFGTVDTPRSVLMLDALARHDEDAQMLRGEVPLRRIRFEYDPSNVSAPSLLQ